METNPRESCAFGALRKEMRAERISPSMRLVVEVMDVRGHVLTDPSLDWEWPLRVPTLLGSMANLFRWNTEISPSRFVFDQLSCDLRIRMLRPDGRRDPRRTDRTLQRQRRSPIRWLLGTASPRSPVAVLVILQQGRQTL